MKLTRAQRALCHLIEAGEIRDVIKLIGMNHPTVKWFRLANWNARGRQRVGAEVGRYTADG